MVLGVIGSFTGAQAASIGLAGNGAQVWEDDVNASGGINGHPVKVIIKDDGLNPAQGIQDAKELVQSDHVMAIIGDNSLVDAAWAPYVTSQGVPVIGGNPTESVFFTNPNRQPAPSTACPNASHVPPVGSATTIDPAYGVNRSDRRARPAKVGATLKSSRTPGPRIAT